MTTTNLGLTLPTVGASTDTWGGILNTDLGIIDAQFPTGTFTPTDASGASLTLTTPVGFYRRVGNMVTIWGSYTMPPTADTNQMTIGGLPFTSANLATNISGFVGAVTFSGGGGTPGGSAPNWFVVNKNATTARFLYAGGTGITNANGTTSPVNFSATYPV